MMDSASTRDAVDQDIEPHEIGGEVADQLVVHGAVAARGALEFVVQVIDHFRQRQVIREHGARGRNVLGGPMRTAAILAQLHECADGFGGQDEVDAHDRLAKLVDVPRVGHFLRPVDFQLLALLGRDLVGHVGCGLHQVDVGFLLQPLLDDLHVQQPEETAAESESQRVAGLRLEIEARIIDRESFQRLAQFGEVLAVGRIQAAVDHPLRASCSRAAAWRPCRPEC